MQFKFEVSWFEKLIKLIKEQHIKVNFKQHLRFEDNFKEQVIKIIIKIVEIKKVLYNIYVKFFIRTILKSVSFFIVNLLKILLKYKDLFRNVKIWKFEKALCKIFSKSLHVTNVSFRYSFKIIFANEKYLNCIISWKICVINNFEVLWKKSMLYNISKVFSLISDCSLYFMDKN